jgi:hypothetical protein
LNASRPDVAALAGRPLRPDLARCALWASGSDLAALAGKAALTDNSWLAFLAALAARSDLAALALRADGPDLAALALQTARADNSWLAFLAALAARSDLATVARRAIVPGLAFGAVPKRSQTRVNDRFQLGAQRDDLGAQLGDHRLRLRLDQRALARPMLPLLFKNMAERFAPSLS